jgi:capsular polysaccharide transport system permease protein
MKLASFTPSRLRWALLYLPMLTAIIYFSVIAAPRYVTETRVSVRMATVQPTVLPGVISMTGSPTPLSYEDTLYLMNFIQSSTMLDKLDAKIQLRKHYESPKLDFLGRLWNGTSKEWFLFYYQNRVMMEFDDLSGLLTIDAQAFDPETSRKLAQAILDISEQWVNDYSWQVARDQITFSETLVKQEDERLQKVKQQVVDFQAKYHLLDPVSQSAAASTLTASLQATLAAQESALAALTSYMQSNTPQIETLRGQIAATRGQLAAERIRATTGGDDDRLSTLNVEYTNLLMGETIAYNNYVAAVAALDAARIDATRKLKSLVIVEAPVKAESAMYPRWAYDLITLLVICILVYTIIRLSIATILEHQD